VRAAEDRGARPERPLEDVYEVEEFEKGCSVDGSSRRFVVPLVESGRRGNSLSSKEDGEVRGERPRMGVRIARMIKDRRVKARRMP